MQTFAFQYVRRLFETQSLFALLSIAVLKECGSTVERWCAMPNIQLANNSMHLCSCIDSYYFTLMPCHPAPSIDVLDFQLAQMPASIGKIRHASVAVETALKNSDPMTAAGSGLPDGWQAPKGQSGHSQVAHRPLLAP